MALWGDICPAFEGRIIGKEDTNVDDVTDLKSRHALKLIRTSNDFSLIFWASYQSVAEWVSDHLSFRTSTSTPH